MTLIIASLAAGLTQSPPPIVSPALRTPPIVTVASPEPALAAFQPGEPRCGGVVQKVRHSEPPLPSSTFDRPAAAALPSEIRLDFRISAEGRPLSIAPARQTSPVHVGDALDVAAAFAAWQFAPGAPREDCQISFTVAAARISQADMDAVYRFLVLVPPATRNAYRSLSWAAFERVHPSGSDCYRRAPAVRQRAYPAYENIPQRPGTLSYTFIAFDIAASGKPVNVKIAASSGNPGLDRQSVEAVAKSRFAPEARRGCTYAYRKLPTQPVPAPEAPEASSLKPADSNCSDDVARLDKLPPLVFPEEFRRRSIEGWAIIRYDIAPWGSVGNVSVAAAEPAARFGQQALSTVSQAKKAESQNGYRGCMVRVRFRMAGENRPDSPDP